MITDLIDPVGDLAGSLAGKLAGASFGLVAIALALHACKLAARARAWHNIARAAFPEEQLRFRHSLGAYLGGIGTNAVLPARPGEVLKLALVHRKAPGTRYQGLASTLLTESVFDTVTGAVVLTLAIALGWTLFGGSLPAPLALVAGHPWLAGLAALAAGVAAVLAYRLLGRKARRVVAGGSRGFAVLRQPRRYLTGVASWQLIALAFRIASILCFLAAFHIPATITTALLVVAVQSASNLIPLTPNGAGTQQALVAVALGASAVSFGTGMQLATTAIEVCFAAVSLVLMTGSLRWRRALEAPELALAKATP